MKTSLGLKKRLVGDVPSAAEGNPIAWVPEFPKGVFKSIL